MSDQSANCAGHVRHTLVEHIHNYYVYPIGTHIAESIDKFISWRLILVL